MKHQSQNTVSDFAIGMTVRINLPVNGVSKWGGEEYDGSRCDVVALDYEHPSVYVKLIFNGVEEHCWFLPEELCIEDTEPSAKSSLKMSVESCVEFLTKAGYEVTLRKSAK
jgi:hypothetical protein